MIRPRIFRAVLFFFAGILAAQETSGALREYRNGNYEQAVQICRQEIAANPSDLESHVVMCWSLVALRRYGEAKNFALAGRAISRYDPRVVEVLGEIYYFQGYNNEALQHFQEYVSLAPQGNRIDMVYYYFAELFIRLEKFQHADIALSTAVYYRPKNAEWWTRLGYARESAGNIQDAIRAYETAISLNPQLADVRRALERVKGR